MSTTSGEEPTTEGLKILRTIEIPWALSSVRMVQVKTIYYKEM